MIQRVIVTGGAGFIGSAVIRLLMAETDATVLNLDKLTYAANTLSLVNEQSNPRYRLVKGDLNDRALLRRLFDEFRPDCVLHLAAESHVDRSIDDAADFISTNVVGTFSILQETLNHWRTLKAAEQKKFRFCHISTDEVFGSLHDDGAFEETTRYDPNSPYAASKAASDHLVRAWHRTYGLPILISNCSNNYGPCQFPEKLIPLIILRGLHGQEIPVYGKGDNVRDWIHVEDHARALLMIALSGEVGETYLVGSRAERRNLDVVKAIVALLDELRPDPEGSRERLIKFVADRPGHDFRYAIAPDKIMRDLGWKPRESFESGLRKTVEWYLANPQWWEPIRVGTYQGERLGIQRAHDGEPLASVTVA